MSGGRARPCDHILCHFRQRRLHHGVRDLDLGHGQSVHRDEGRAVEESRRVIPIRASARNAGACRGSSRFPRSALLALGASAKANWTGRAGGNGWSRRTTCPVSAWGPKTPRPAATAVLASAVPRSAASRTRRRWPPTPASACSCARRTQEPRERRARRLVGERAEAGDRGRRARRHCSARSHWLAPSSRPSSVADATGSISFGRVGGSGMSMRAAISVSDFRPGGRQAARRPRSRSRRSDFRPVRPRFSERSAMVVPVWPCASERTATVVPVSAAFRSPWRRVATQRAEEARKSGGRRV